MSDDDIEGGANVSYHGYDYQMRVTIWVALELICGPDARTDSIVVEPASHDDVAAKLAVDREAAEASLRVDQVELHVQVKFKGAGAWSAKDFAAVVNDRPRQGARGPAPRARAKAMLVSHPLRRYLFITNASVDGVLAKGRVNTPQAKAPATFLPTNLGGTSDERAGLAGRFALIEHMTHTETRRRIDELLQRDLHVPPQNLDACVERLRRMVEDRLLGVATAPLRKADIEKVAEGFGGAIHELPQLARYVAPSNRSAADERLDRNGAILLVGPAGYGKTLTAESLVHERRRADPPYKVVREIEGLGAIEAAMATPGPVIFHLEDPWGQTGLNKIDADEWTSRLGKLLRRATAEKQFVITSRSEVYRAALGNTPAPMWSECVITIDGDAYDIESRKAMLFGKLALAASWMLDLTRQHEARLLSDLRSPLEIDGFARGLTTLTNPGQSDISQLIGRALTDSRRHVVRDMVRAHGDRGVRGSAVLWALLRSSREISIDQLRALRRVVDQDRRAEIALDDLAEHLAPSLFEMGKTGYRTHSTVIEALEGLARSNARPAEDSLNAVIRAASQMWQQKPGGGGRDLLVRLLFGVQRMEDDGVLLLPEVRAAAESCLIGALERGVEDRHAFERAWEDASRHLSDGTAIGRLVHWLDKGARSAGRKHTLASGWIPPAIGRGEKKAAVSTVPAAAILNGFIAYMLPTTSEIYDADLLLPWLQEFGVDLKEAFMAACDIVAEARHHVMNADTVSEGALSWPAPDYEVVWSKVAKLSSHTTALLEASRPARQQAWQAVDDMSEQLRLLEDSDESMGTANEFAKGYVRARRRLQGFQWIPGHPDQAWLMELWVATMKDRKLTVTSTELDAYFSLIGGDDQLWANGLEVIGLRRLVAERHRVLDALKSGGRRALDKAVDALAYLEGGGQSGSPEAAETVLLKMLPQLSLGQAAALAPLIAGLYTGPRKSQAAARVVAEASPDRQAALELALAKELSSSSEVLIDLHKRLSSDQATELMHSGPRNLTRLLLCISAAEGHDVEPLAAQWLGSDDQQDAKAAAFALANLGTLSARTALAQGLGHKDYKIRQLTLDALAPEATDPERALILACAVDQSAPVRETVVSLIGQMGWTDGLPTLIKCLTDRRDTGNRNLPVYRIEPEFKVARAAADSLRRFEELPASVIGDVIAFLQGGAASSSDVSVHASLFHVLAKAGDSRIDDLLLNALRDDRVVGMNDENLYPVRYAAAWCLEARISSRFLAPSAELYTALLKAAEHVDPQLAAPALFALGMLLAASVDMSTLIAVRDANLSPVRMALLLSAFEGLDQARSLAVAHSLLPEDHPLLEPVAQPAATGGTQGRWPLTQSGQEWARANQAGVDVQPWLAAHLSERTGIALGNPDFDPVALRRRQPMSVTTVHELSGLE